LLNGNSDKHRNNMGRLLYLTDAPILETTKPIRIIIEMAKMNCHRANGLLIKPEILRLNNKYNNRSKM
jgi:hypothetical protein